MPERVPRCVAGSDSEGEVVEGDAEPVAARDPGGNVVVAAAQVLNEGMSRSENPGRAVTLESSHRPEASLQPPVTCLDRVVRMPLHGVQARGNQLIGDSRVSGRAVRRNLGRDRAGAQCPGEGAPCGGQEATH